MVAGDTRFAFDLYGQLKGKGGNLFYSPFSISTALSMVYDGARDGTANEMRSVLHLPGEHEQVASSFEQLRKSVFTGQAEAVKLLLANRLYAQTGLTLKPEFTQGLNDHYGAPLEQLDFSNQSEASRQHINDWVSSQTQDRIKDLIPKGVLSSSTSLVLVNAIYFKAPWLKQFVPDRSAAGDFHSANGKAAQVTFMHQRSNFFYGEQDGVQLLELPYQGETLSMVILLPQEADGFSKLESALNEETLSSWLSKLSSNEVELTLPRFRIESQFSLGDTLRKMGMKTAMDCSQRSAVDFSGMDDKRDLCLSAVIHKAFIQVDEAGTEAAAATAAVMKGRAMRITKPIVFNADHPFFFVLRDRSTNTILFMGRLMNP